LGCATVVGTVVGEFTTTPTIGDGREMVVSRNAELSNDVAGERGGTVTRLDVAVEVVVISVVGPLEPTVLDNGVTLDDPDELLDGVVKVKLNLVVGLDNALVTSELKLFNEVLVRDLGETATLIGIKEDVVDEKGGLFKATDADASSAGASNGELGVTVAALD